MDDQLDSVCKKLDDLTILQFDLLDEQLKMISKLENVLMNGFIHLAKSRYIKGERSVSTLQIPGEESDVQPTTTVLRNSENKLEIQKNVNSNDPIKWFGVLVPSSLRQSQSSFQQVLEIVVEIVNTRMEAAETMKEFNQLSKTKAEY